MSAAEHTVAVASALLNLATSIDKLSQLAASSADGAAVISHAVQALQQCHSIVVKAWSAVSNSTPSASAELQGALDYSVEVRSLLNLVQDRREADVQHCLLALDAVTGALVQVGTSCSLLPTVQQGWPAHGADSPPQHPDLIGGGMGPRRGSYAFSVDSTMDQRRGSAMWTAGQLPAEHPPREWHAGPPGGVHAWQDRSLGSWGQPTPPPSGAHPPPPTSSMAELLRSGAAARAHSMRVAGGGAGRDSITSASVPLQPSHHRRLSSAVEVDVQGGNQAPPRRHSAQPQSMHSLQHGTNLGAAVAAAGQSLASAIRLRGQGGGGGGGGGGGRRPPMRGSIALDSSGPMLRRRPEAQAAPHPRSARASAPPTTLGNALVKGAPPATGLAGAMAPSHPAPMSSGQGAAPSGGVWPTPRPAQPRPPPAMLGGGLLDQVPEEGSERERGSSVSSSRSGGSGLLGSAPPPPPTRCPPPGHAKTGNAPPSPSAGSAPPPHAGAWPSHPPTGRNTRSSSVSTSTGGTLSSLGSHTAQGGDDERGWGEAPPSGGDPPSTDHNPQSSSTPSARQGSTRHSVAGTAPSPRQGAASARGAGQARHSVAGGAPPPSFSSQLGSFDLGIGMGGGVGLWGEGGNSFGLGSLLATPGYDPSAAFSGLGTLPESGEE